MRTDNVPFSAPPPGNAAPNAAQAGNFYLNDIIANGFNNGYAPTNSNVYDSNQNYLTDVGAYTAASSYYGTFDQGDDLSSWDETIITGTKRGQRGGSWVGSEGTLRSTYRYSAPPSFEDVAYGMRIALVYAPGDFNGDGVVDAADYVIWRKYDGSDAAGYETWRAHFGDPSSAGTGAANFGELSQAEASPHRAAIPESSTALLLILGTGLGTLKGYRNNSSRTISSCVIYPTVSSRNIIFEASHV
jgi:hypothetical protein